MGLFGKKKDSNLVVVLYEGPGRLRLNGNRKKGREVDVAKKGATVHEHTVCWVEFSQGGKRLDEGKGPSALKLGPGEAEKILRELHMSPACRTMLSDLEGGQDRSAKILSWENRNEVTKPT